MGVVIAAGADHAAVGVLLIRAKHDRIVGNGGERLIGDFSGKALRPPRLAQHARQNPETDGRLIGPARAIMALANGFIQFRQCPGIMRIVPELAKLRGKMTERRVEGLGRQRKNLDRYLQPCLGGKCCIRHQGTCRRRTIDERQDILFRNGRGRRQRAESM